ncbi:AAA family ATPase, partial [Chondromyces apiculatus]|uniref:Serine/threonine kinase with two-component sensor domain protein n=1 Tax=Chondromyces apiculatus DSM 436 TaxID=1192034 RepID=A0A017T1J0_9BACT
MDLRRFLEQAIQLSSALSRIHQAGSLHLDIRPANVFVNPESGAVDLQGGLASSAGELEPGEEPKILPASLPYLAPERTGRVEQAADQRTDLYSLGVTLYEMYSGKRPFEADDAPEWVHCHIARAPTSLLEAVPEAPRILWEILSKLLAKAPEDRYQTALGLATDLQTCLSRLDRLGNIEPFELRTADLSDKLQIPAKLYGRERERAILLEAFERVIGTGAAELVLVAGYSGIGKTSLVREVQAPIVRERGNFISGKFEQLQRDVPYRTISQSFGELVRQLLTESPESLSAWKRRILEALGQNGRLITDIVPQLAVIIGEQPPVPSLPLAEAQTRFLRVFQAFIGAVARRKHPLVLFVDDLQWADPASLRLLRHLISTPEARHLLVIGAYRDNEVTPSHPLIEALEGIRSAGANISTIFLGPLQHEHVMSLLMDALHCDELYAAPLTGLLAQKTGGNPFFVGQFLADLYRKKLIRVDPAHNAWRYDIEEIEAQELTENVVDLVLSRLKRLGPDTQRVLTLAACIGSRVEADILASMHGQSPQKTHADLGPAIREGLIVRRASTYKFLHDRVQQAAYLLIPKDKRAETHLRVGRLLLVQTPEAALEARLFEITNQLNIGAALITDADERRRVASMNLRAGRKAKVSGAYGSAVTYFTAGCVLIGGTDWTEDNDALGFALHLDLADASFLNGDFEQARNLSIMLLARARTPLDKAAVYRVQMQIHTTHAEHERCIDTGLECLALLELNISRKPTNEELIAELTELQSTFRERSPEDLVKQPRMTEPEKIVLMNVMAVMYASAYYTDPNLSDMLVCKMSQLSLAYGNTEASGMGYASVGKAFCVRLGAYEDGDRMGRVGFELTDVMNAATYKPEVANMVGTAIVVWTRHLQAAIEYARIGVQAANDIGSTTWGSFNHVQLCFDLLVRGDVLDEVLKTCVAALDYMNKAKLGFTADVVTSFLRFVQAMRGTTDGLASLDGEGFETQAFEAHIEKDSFPTVRLFYYTMKMQACFLADAQEEAVQAAADAERNAAGGEGTLLLAEYHYHAALARAAHFQAMTPALQAETRGKLADHLERLRQWAKNCPENFSGKQSLIAAELARLEGRTLEAASFYDQAIGSFRQNRFIHQEALASELAARFYIGNNYTGLPGLYLREAVSAYSRWGASAKVRHLEQQYALVLDQEQRRATSHGVMKMAAEAVDAQTAVKVSRALSGDMTPAEMMGSLMRLVIEHEGADRCCLLLLSGDGLRLVAEGIVGREGINIRVFERGAAPAATRIPMAIINYVQRTRERVLISNLAERNAFGADEYLTREQPKSVLCLPLMKSPGEVGGMLYLENRLVHGAFILRRLSILEFLASLSLQNTVLRDDLAQESTKRKQAEEALQRNEKLLRELVEST